MLMLILLPSSVASFYIFLSLVGIAEFKSSFGGQWWSFVTLMSRLSKILTVWNC
jgi:hypothetical protein